MLNTGRLVRFGVVAFAAAFAGGVGLIPAAATGGGGPVAAAILGSGSDTTQFMMDSVDSIYRFSPGCAQIPTGGVSPPPPTAWLDFSCQSPDPVSVSRTGTSSNGSATVLISDTTDIAVGDQVVSGPGVQPGTYVSSVTTNTSFFMSSSTWQNVAQPAGAGAGTGTFNFSHVMNTENYTHDQPTEAYFLGSGNGISQLCKQGQAGVAHIDFARSSRAIKGTDCAGLHAVAYAKDGISWEVFTGTGTDSNGMNNTGAPCAGGLCLTQAQLKAIFLTCTISDWNQLNPSVPVGTTINMYTPQPGSGTRATFDGFLGGSSDTCINARGTSYASTHIVPENSNTPIIANGEQNSAIFPFSFGVWSNGNNPNTALGAVDGVAVSASTIGDGSFPYSRNLYNVYCSATCPNGASSTQAINYVGETGWMCKLGSQHSINPLTGRNFHTDLYFAYTTNGFVPMPGGAIGGGVQGADYCRLTAQ